VQPQHGNQVTREPESSLIPSNRGMWNVDIHASVMSPPDLSHSRIAGTCHSAAADDEEIVGEFFFRRGLAARVQMISQEECKTFHAFFIDLDANTDDDNEVTISELQQFVSRSFEKVENEEWFDG